ncbi:unnamed protein product [Oppiella nova]|uniref:alpha-L-rhamnosidase n=1 Tax=Oppiella nova TaxID=334625 RepID=A0A7R9QU18_9ACAR|nr:unnamed protein product [Oppiella nova]CAG2175518.1 unnamed protein product [Oppiella nova]
MVVNSDTPFESFFETSNEMVNKLYSNIHWSQRGNFMSVPTDCPQRDERLGWTGDAEIFAPTAAYNADVSAFYTKWMRDMRDGQSKEGGFPDIAPRIEDPQDGAPAWGDAGVIVPYTVYRMYGDIEIIEDNYSAMKRWMDYIGSQNPSYIWTKRVNSNYGDWLQVGADTPKEVLSTAYYGYDALLMAKMAKAVNRTEDHKKYSELHTNIGNAFVKAFVNTTDATIKGDTQTVYVIAVAFELLPQNLIPLAANHLVDNIKAHDWHLTTGFVGVGYLCPTLSQLGHSDVAYRLLLQDTYPSWGYSIKYNATTIWERWDGWTKEKGFQDPSSFNHYSLGSVGRWLFQSVAGIDTHEEGVGFKSIVIAPKPGGNLQKMTARYASIHGLIGSSWETNGANITLTIDIPVNTKALIDLSFLKQPLHTTVGSGRYVYEGELTQPFTQILDSN